MRPADEFFTIINIPPSPLRCGAHNECPRHSIAFEVALIDVALVNFHPPNAWPELMSYPKASESEFGIALEDAVRLVDEAGHSALVVSQARSSS